MPPALDRVSIVIPVYGRWALTRACLVSLARTAPDAEIIVVDNGSPDRAGLAIALTRRSGVVDEPWPERLRLVSLPHNRQFAGGSNVGLYAATGDVVVFLNNDTVAFNPPWLARLVAPLDDATVGVVGALLWYPGSVRCVQHAGMAWATRRQPIHLYRHQREGSEPGIARRKDLQCVTGACLALRRDVARELRGFDVGYRNSHEDVDLCFRARFLLGLRVVYEPAAQLIHHEGQTPGRFDAEAAAAARFMDRWGDRIEVDAAAVVAADRSAAPGFAPPPKGWPSGRP